MAKASGKMKGATRPTYSHGSIPDFPLQFRDLLLCVGRVVLQSDILIFEFTEVVRIRGAHRLEPIACFALRACKVLICSIRLSRVRASKLMQSELPRSVFTPASLVAQDKSSLLLSLPWSPPSSPRLLSTFDLSESLPLMESSLQTLALSRRFSGVSWFPTEPLPFPSNTLPSPLTTLPFPTGSLPFPLTTLPLMPTGSAFW